MITLTQSLTGFEIQLIGVDGKRIQLTVDDVVAPRTERRLSRQGMPENGGGRGDLVFRFKSTFPENMSPKQKATIKQHLA
jgi:DnaJ-class molecular chaperone